MIQVPSPEEVAVECGRRLEQVDEGRSIEAARLEAFSRQSREPGNDRGDHPARPLVHPVDVVRSDDCGDEGQYLEAVRGGQPFRKLAKRLKGGKARGVDRALVA